MEPSIVSGGHLSLNTPSLEFCMDKLATVIDFFGQSINLSNLTIFVVLFGVFFLFYRIQRNSTLDFADMVTKNGRTVSLTKVLQLIGGLTATWVIVKLTLNNTLTESLFGLYLTYVGCIEGYSKFVSAKYNYQETSVRDHSSAPVKTPPQQPRI